jgi:hypothetical protein
MGDVLSGKEFSAGYKKTSKYLESSDSTPEKVKGDFSIDRRRMKELAELQNKILNDYNSKLSNINYSIGNVVSTGINLPTEQNLIKQDNRLEIGEKLKNKVDDELKNSLEEVNTLQEEYLSGLSEGASRLAKAEFKKNKTILDTILNDLSDSTSDKFKEAGRKLQMAGKDFNDKIDYIAKRREEGKSYLKQSLELAQKLFDSEDSLKTKLGYTGTKVGVTDMTDFATKVNVDWQKKQYEQNKELMNLNEEANKLAKEHNDILLDLKKELVSKLTNSPSNNDIALALALNVD